MDPSHFYYLTNGPPDPHLPREAPNFDVGDAYMWDSAKPAASVMAHAAPKSDVADATVSDLGGPGVAAATAQVPTRMEGRTLVLTPSGSLLTSPTSVFPIYIDPTSSSPVRSYWTMIDSGHTSQSYWNYDRGDHAKVGDAGDGVNMYRSLFQFSTSAWKGKHVTDVTFSSDLKHSWSCSNTSTEVHISSQATISSSTTWSSNSSTWGSSLDTASNENCTDASGVHTEWNSSALTSGVAAKNNASSIVIGLRAADESSASAGWKKFDETSGAGGAHLSVTYNTAPTSSSLLLDGTACSTSSSSPKVLTTLGSPAHNPVPQVTVKDAEGDKSTVTFTYPKAGGGTTTTAYSKVDNNASQKLTGGIPAANIPSGSTVYSWKVTVSDGTDSSTSSPCYFKIDNTIPAAPVVTSADGLYVDDDAIHGGVGKPGTFTLTGTAGITKYVWGGGPGEPGTTVTTTNGAPVTVSYTPTDEGDNSIQVYGYNAVGTKSAEGALSFLVGSPDTEVGKWALNGDGTDTGSGNHTLATSGIAWTSDARVIGASAATLDGVSSSANTSANVTPTNTSFGVSAWVRPQHLTGTATDGFMTAVSESGTATSAFQLQYRYSYPSAPGSWCFTMRATDTDPGPSLVLACTPIASLCDNATATKCNWALLSGVYDASASAIRLYVNGVLKATTPYSPTWTAAGPLVIGTRLASGVQTDNWRGDISDVHVWDRVIYQSDIDALSPVALAGEWDMADTTGTDAILAHPITWTNNPTPAFDDVNATPALGFDSALNQYGLATGPVVRTDMSYSVAAWVSPAVVSTTASDGYMTAVSQDGEQTAGFQLQYRFNIGSPDKQEWCLTARSADAASGSTTPPTLTTACAQVTSGTTVVNPGVNLWTHLVGVYDANLATMTLYIDGTAKATTAYTPTWNAAGPLAVASRWEGDHRTDMWHGAIDHVEMFTGALNSDQVSNLFNYGDAFH